MLDQGWVQGFLLFLCLWTSNLSSLSLSSSNCKMILNDVYLFCPRLKSLILHVKHCLSYKSFCKSVVHNCHFKIISIILFKEFFKSPMLSLSFPILTSWRKKIEWLLSFYLSLPPPPQHTLFFFFFPNRGSKSQRVCDLFKVLELVSDKTDNWVISLLCQQLYASSLHVM